MSLSLDTMTTSRVAEERRAQRTDHVVRFKSRPLQNRDAQRLNHAANVGNLFSEVGRHLRPVALYSA